jgi:hypothetical protein
MAMQRPWLAAKSIQRLIPSLSKMACVVFCIIFHFQSTFFTNLILLQNSKSQRSGCSGMVTFGNITTKFSGNLPPVSFTKPETKKYQSMQTAFFHFFVKKGLIRSDKW